MSLTSGTAGSEREERESEQLGLGSWRLGQRRERGEGDGLPGKKGRPKREEGEKGQAGLWPWLASLFPFPFLFLFQTTQFNLNSNEI
jgi:hypothetical protein